MKGKGFHHRGHREEIKTETEIQLLFLSFK